MDTTLNTKGQAAVEFSLIAPLLFLFFFCVIQMAYTAYVSFAVQRAALAIARKTTLSPGENSSAFKTQLALSLLPIVNLNSKTLLTIFEAQYHATVSLDKKKVLVQVRYPMPIWIPIVRNIFGEPLILSHNYNNNSDEPAINSILSFLKKSDLLPSFKDTRLPVRWIVFEETTFNESYQAQ